MTALIRLEQRIRTGLGGTFRSTPNWSNHERMAAQAYAIVQIYYIMVAMQLSGSSRGLRDIASSASELTLLWPVAWLNFVPFDLGLFALANAYVVVSFIGIIFWRYLLVRLCVCVVVLQWSAIQNAFGAINHGFHEMFWISFCFLFLPSSSRKNILTVRKVRTRFLYAFSVAPALILFFYTLSGIYKVQDAAVALLTGQYGGFMPDAMAQTLARRSLETLSDPLWAPFIIENAYIGWPLYLGLYYIEIVAIFILWRPQLIKVWGIMLIGFHFGTVTFMDISFDYHIFINGLLFIMSPYAATDFKLGEALKQLPLIGVLFRRKTQ